MQTSTAAQRFVTLDHKMPLEQYNPEHFRTRHLLEDGARTLASRGIQPGEVAPDFELPQAEGGSVRLSDLRGKPVVLHFGSYT